MKTLLFALMSIALTCQAQPLVGGGGENTNGIRATFYESGFYIEPQPSVRAADVVGVAQVIAFVQAFPYWTQSEKTELLGLTLPSGDSTGHRYYQILESQFDGATRAQVLAQYAQVTGFPVGKLDVWAVTDREQKITYLLPGFNKLNPTQAAAIIFHENYWLWKMQDTYEDTLHAETNFEAAYLHPENARTAIGLINANSDLVRALALADLQSGALKGLIEPRGIPLRKLFGEDFFNRTQDTNAPAGLIRLNLFNLLNQYPNSFILDRINKEVHPHDDYSKVAVIHGAMTGVDTDGRREISATYSTLYDLVPSETPNFHFKALCEMRTLLVEQILGSGTVSDTERCEIRVNADLKDCYLEVAPDNSAAATKVASDEGGLPINCGGNARMWLEF